MNNRTYFEDDSEDTEEDRYEDCPMCRQDVLMLTGTGYHWKCSTCGYAKRVEREEQ